METWGQLPPALLPCMAMLSRNIKSSLHDAIHAERISFASEAIYAVLSAAVGGKFSKFSIHKSKTKCVFREGLKGLRPI